MKKALSLLSLLVLSTSVLATVPTDFVGEYKLLKGSPECEQNFSITEFENENGLCLSIKRNSPGMGWAKTEKICNINQQLPLLVEDIPAPVYVGTITTSDFSLMKDTMITSADILYHGVVQTTEYDDGRVYKLQNETYLLLNEDQNLVFDHKEFLLNNGLVDSFEATNCTYQRL